MIAGSMVWMSSVRRSRNRRSGSAMRVTRRQDITTSNTMVRPEMPTTAQVKIRLLAMESFLR